MMNESDIFENCENTYCSWRIMQGLETLDFGSWLISLSSWSAASGRLDNKRINYYDV